ncbi:amidohydrolase [Alkalihalobacterium chitinilyticum]|uniref:5-methylthioadenosine/S-adenosylhomocysteine deaminase n=1 Tax=Alkalihalobacterium chitinilyticum TaxID=2980103 RepID=A0ABT5V8T8_9BACI|nr:amidohydrolase [Alkalihalobacterium chitinilyticum]MDE5411889.1 amidohydrolase [Alkalihalobacterium chitinilyticum]
MDKVFYNGVIITANEKDEVYSSGYVHVRAGKFIEVGSGYPDHIGTEEANFYNLNGRWLLPGLINTHGHTPMTLLRGHSDDLPLKRWLQEKMWPMEQKLTREAVIVSSKLAMVEMLKSGTTTFLDMYHLFLDDIANVVDEIGMRAVITRGIIGLCSREEQIAKLDEAMTIAKSWHGKGDGRITTMLSPHSPYLCPPDYIAEIASEARTLGVPVHTHMSETAQEVEESVNKYGKRPVELLQSTGFFDGASLVAHAVHVNDEELEILTEHQVAVSHNPMSNLKLGSGIASIQKMLSKGITVSIGTDSVASNNNLDLIQEMRTAILLQKGINQDPTAVKSAEGIKLITVNGAKALGLRNTIGSIEKGLDADFIIMQEQQAHLQPAMNALSHLVYSASGADVIDVYVKGKQLVKNRECLYLDEEKIITECNDHYRKMLK